jgi:two-component system, NtrC family, sensor kinase
MSVESSRSQERQNHETRTSVLLIDDEPAVVEGLKEFLEDEGYEVFSAYDGRQGLELFKQYQPALVVTDLRMPGIAGMEVIRRIKELREDAAVIVITGYGSLKSAVAAIRQKVFDFITKPIDLYHLKTTLDRARDSSNRAMRIQKEIESLRDQLASAETHLQEYQLKMSETESMALAGRLLAGILHNLNSPLTYIMGQAQMLQMIHPEVTNLEKIEEQAVRMGQIITATLKKVKQSQVRQREFLQLNEVLIEEALFLDSHPYFRHEIHKEWNLAHDLPLFEGIAADFSQVFGNLLRNAAEAMKAQETKQLVLTSRHDEHEIQIYIRDSGPGIPKNFQEQIFKPFFSSKTQELGISGSVGMGLGLYNSQQLIKSYGGKIEVASQRGRGATFIVTLPKVRCMEAVGTA